MLPQSYPPSGCARALEMVTRAEPQKYGPDHAPKCQHLTIYLSH